MYHVLIQCFSNMADQKTAEGGNCIVSPDICICTQAHIHLVPLLQLQEHCIASVISPVMRRTVVIGRHNNLVVLDEG